MVQEVAQVMERGVFWAIALMVFFGGLWAYAWSVGEATLSVIGLLLTVFIPILFIGAWALKKDKGVIEARKVKEEAKKEAEPEKSREMFVETAKQLKKLRDDYILALTKAYYEYLLEQAKKYWEERGKLEMNEYGKGTRLRKACGDKD
jgi:L-lactate permease